MVKVEKYHQYVIEDLVKDTRIDYDKKSIYLPFPSSSPTQLFLTPPSYSSSFLFLGLSLSSTNLFHTYVEGKYGLKDDVDIQIIWDQYKERIKENIG